MAMMKGKRGFFFTLASVIFLMLILLFVKHESNTQLREKSFVIQSRVSSLDHFVADVNKDIERGVYIASFRAFLAIQQYITAQGDFINDTHSILQELIVNGSIDGEYMSVMNDTELSLWVERISYEAESIGIDFDYSIMNITIYHTDPWTVQIQADLTLNISDSSGLAYWYGNKSVNSSLSIIGFEDPLYSVNTYGRIVNTIEETTFTDFVDGTDTTNLKQHAENSYYIASTSSPSYLMRLSGIHDSSTYGIESLVNLRKLEDMYVDIENKSCVDYIYFSTSNPTSYLINDTFNWLRIDNESNHLEIYEVEAIIVP